MRRRSLEEFHGVAVMFSGATHDSMISLSADIRPDIPQKVDTPPAPLPKPAVASISCRSQMLHQHVFIKALCREYC